MDSYQTGTVLWGVIGILISVALVMLACGIARLIPHKPDESGKLFTPFTKFVVTLIVISMFTGYFFILKLMTGDIQYRSFIAWYRDFGLPIDDYQVGGIASFLTLFSVGVLVNRAAKLKK